LMGMGRNYRIAVLPGDGVGPEVITESVKVLDVLGLDLEFVYCDVGSTAYAKTGTPFPEEAMEACDEADAALLGTVGQSYAPYEIPKKVSTYLRIDRDAYASVCPLKLFAGVYPPEDVRSQRDIDIVVVRDNIEGFSLNHEGYIWDGEGVDKRRTTHEGASRIVEFAFNYALKEDRRMVTCIDAHNLLFSDKVFRRAFKITSEKYPHLSTEWMSVNIASMMLTRYPDRFDVIVVPYVYGDMLMGSIIGQIGGVGLAPSASIGDEFAVFEPVHGAAWDIAGRGIANPIGSILSAKMMLDWLGLQGEGAIVENAVRSALNSGKVRTPDMGGNSSTSEMGDTIAFYVRNEPLLDQMSPMEREAVESQLLQMPQGEDLNVEVG
jgi:isocitrate/isopropylmalate dehydrogenase